MARILIIEDNQETAMLVVWRLTKEGHELLHAPEGARGLEMAASKGPDLIVLDWMLPGMDGLEVCRRLRQFTEAPILMLTANGEVNDRIRGLEGGATDYLPKPFELEELVARVKAQLRLVRPQPRTLLEFADLQLDTRSYDVKRNDRPIALTPKEFDLLLCLMRSPHQAIARHRLITEVWGHDYDGDDNVLDVFIGTLRKKIDVPPAPKLIHTVRGFGYLLKLEYHGE